MARKNPEDLALKPAGRLVLLGLVGGLMLVPVAVIRLIDRGESDSGDFIFLALLLAGVALALEVAARVRPRRAYAAGVGLGVLTGLLQLWINLAVGIIGSEDNPFNLIYAGVVAVALTAALLARFGPGGMAVAMAAAAGAQLLTFVAALGAGLGFTGPITIFFTALWLIAGLLFRKAAAAEATR